MMTSSEAVAAVVVPDDETLFERRARALTLRNAGATFRQIADKTGVSPASARKDVEAALREVVAETAESMIARQRSILFDIQRANYAAAASGDVDAARLIIATLEREARLFGLDAPTRVSVGVSDVEFAERTASLIESLGLQPPKELVRYAHTSVGDVEDSVLDVEVEPAGGPLVEGPADASAGSPGDPSEASVESPGDWSNI